jgi:hypothetical protein
VRVLFVHRAIDEGQFVTNARQPTNDPPTRSPASVESRGGQLGGLRARSAPVFSAFCLFARGHGCVDAVGHCLQGLTYEVAESVRVLAGFDATGVRPTARARREGRRLAG